MGRIWGALIGPFGGQVLHASLQTCGISAEDAGWESLGEALWFADVCRDESLVRL